MRKYMYVSLGVLIVLLIAVTGLTIYYNSPGRGQAVQLGESDTQANSEPAGKYANVESAVANDNASYYLVLENDKVSIYKGDEKTFYDYADLNMETMPIEIKEQLKYGLYINTVQELYEFLQTYSS